MEKSLISKSASKRLFESLDRVEVLRRPRLFVWLACESAQYGRRHRGERRRTGGGVVPRRKFAPDYASPAVRLRSWKSDVPAVARKARGADCEERCSLSRIELYDDLL